MTAERISGAKVILCKPTGEIADRKKGQPVFLLLFLFAFLSSASGAWEIPLFLFHGLIQMVRNFLSSPVPCSKYARGPFVCESPG